MSFDVDYRVSSGTSVFGGAVGEVINFADGLPRPDGSIIKTGAGAFAVKHFRTHVMNIDEGLLRVTQSSSTGGTPDFVGSTDGTSLVRRLKLDGISYPGQTLQVTPTVKLDLQNNDLIVDWKDKFNTHVGTLDLYGPLGTLVVNSSGTVSAEGYLAGLRTAYLGSGSGIWTGNGITSQIAADQSGTFSIA